MVDNPMVNKIPPKKLQPSNLLPSSRPDLVTVVEAVVEVVVAVVVDDAVVVEVDVED